MREPMRPGWAEKQAPAPFFVYLWNRHHLPQKNRQCWGGQRQTKDVTFTMRMRLAWLALLLLLFNCHCMAQSKLSVAGFRELENDLTAMTYGTERNDQNGERAALIKVVTLERGFTFDGGSLGIVHSEQHEGEVWVYVPQHAQRITINHPDFGMLRNYYYPISIRAGRTYEMLLDIGAGRYVNIFTEPGGAVVSLNGQSLGLSPIYNKYLPYGEYTVRASSGFVNGEENVSISPTDTKEARTLTIQMKELSEEDKAKALDEANIKPTRVSPPKTTKRTRYYVKLARVLRVYMNLTRITPAPQLEKFANLILFGDTISASLDQGIERLLSTQGEEKNNVKLEDVTNFYNFRMDLTGFRKGYYYSYYLEADYDRKNKRNRKCHIIYDAVTDRILSISDVFNPATVKDIYSKAGKRFIHMAVSDDQLTIQYLVDNDYETEVFNLDDQLNLTPYFMALVNESRKEPDESKKNADVRLSEEEDVLVFDVVEQMPEFPGGKSALSEYLSKKTKYPPTAEEKGIQGRVIVSFVVDIDGSIKNVKVVKPVHTLLDKEAMRVVRSMPKWNVGVHEGQQVRVKYTVPVDFKLR